MFGALFHADWSIGPEKRWALFAVWKDEVWLVKKPFLVPPSKQLLDFLFGVAEKTPVLSGFDFPIGLPKAYGSRTGLPGFTSALLELGRGRWDSFFDVCEIADEISIERPFYPRRSSSAAKQHHLIQATAFHRSTSYDGGASVGQRIAGPPARYFGHLAGIKLAKPRSPAGARS